MELMPAARTWYRTSRGTDKIGVMPRKTSAIVPASAISPPAIETRIHQIRGLRVMLDRDLAEMYGVDTKILNKAVSRNASRFPADFSFVLTPVDLEELEVPIWNLKIMGRPKAHAKSVYRAGRGDAVHRPQESAGQWQHRTWR